MAAPCQAILVVGSANSMGWWMARPSPGNQATQVHDTKRSTRCGGRRGGGRGAREGGGRSNIEDEHGVQHCFNDYASSGQPAAYILADRPTAHSFTYTEEKKYQLSSKQLEMQYRRV